MVRVAPSPRTKYRAEKRNTSIDRDYYTRTKTVGMEEKEEVRNEWVQIEEEERENEGKSEYIRGAGSGFGPFPR
jgi:hypothetical protein